MNINNAILHVLDFESCANVFAQTPLSLANKTAKRYVTSQAKRTLSNMDRRRGTFEEGSSFGPTCGVSATSWGCPPTSRSF